MSERWEEPLSVLLVQLWKFLLVHKPVSGRRSKYTDSEVVNENNKLVSLLEKVPGCENVNLEDIIEWLANDEVDEITDNDIVAMVLNEETVEDELIDE